MNDFESSMAVTPSGALSSGPRMQSGRRDDDLLEQARIAWEKWLDFRVRRKRSRDYYRGRPNEVMEDPDTGKLVYEDDYIESQGRIPYKINRIRPAITNLLGQFRASKPKVYCYARNREANDANDVATEGLYLVRDINRLDDIDTDTFAESLISGLYGYKVKYEWNPTLNREEVTVYPVDTTRLFVGGEIKDRRMESIRLIGEVHDLTLQEVVARFAKTREGEAQIRKMYADMQEFHENLYYEERGFRYKDSLDFYIPSNPGLCRVIEVWRYEHSWKRFVHDRNVGTYERMDVSDEDLYRLNQMRLLEAEANMLPPPIPLEADDKYEGEWRVYYMTPKGEIILESDNPFRHEWHPYVIGFGSILDGEVWGLIEDIIDPQRLVNRMTTAIDFMFGASAKGVLLLPEEAIPEGVTIDQFAAEWSKFNGVIKFRAKPGVPLPTQVVAKAFPEGVFQWLEKMGQEIKEVSGVQGAQMGVAPTAGTPNALYQQQIAQAQLNNRDFFDSFLATLRMRDKRIVQMMVQYYNERRLMRVAGRRPDGKSYLWFDPAMVQDIDFEVVMSDVADTPASRQLMEDFLTQLLQQNRLTFRQFLSVSTHPKADAILQVIERSNPLLGDQQLSPEAVSTVMAQLQMAAEAGDRDAMATLDQAR